MSLSTINITKELEQLTDKYIAQADYASLRNACLQLAPISVITEELENLLNQHLATDKQEASRQLTVDACEKQHQHDLTEQEQDRQESQKNLELTTQLEHELIQIQKQKRFITNEIDEIETQIIHQNKRIQEISRQIALMPVSEPIQHTHDHPEPIQHTHDHPELIQHTHDHPELIQHTHDHPESIQHTHGHPEPIQHTHGHPESTQHTHDHPEPTRASLELQKQMLSQNLKQLEEALKKKQLLNQTQQRCIEAITDKLTIELPEKKMQHSTRAKERLIREHARTYKESNERKLTLQNYGLLQQAITEAHDSLTNTQKQLIHQATEINYRTFLTRLGHLGQSLSLSYQEKEALQKIINNMENYLFTQAEKQKQQAIQHLAFIAKGILVQDIQQKENKILQLKQENPQIQEQNQMLELKNKQLEQSTTARGTYRNYLLKIGLFALLGTGIAAGGGFLAIPLLPLALMPLWFAPAAVIGVISVGLFIATLGYSIKNNSENKQLAQNKSTIEQNLDTISEQS